MHHGFRQGTVGGERFVPSWSAIRCHADGSADVQFVLIEHGKAMASLWNLRAHPHALERFAQRSDHGDITAVLVAANRAAPVNAQVYRCADRTALIIPTADSGFVCVTGQQYALART